MAAETTPAIDVWSIGIMFYAMLYGELPFNKNDEKELINSIKKDPLKFPSNISVSDHAKDILRLMMDKDPTKRVELVDFVDMPYNLMDEEELDKIIK